MKITADYLLDLHACADQVALFAALWPDGVEVTRATLRQATAAGLDLDWWMHHDPQCAFLIRQYREASAPLWRQYREASAPLRRQRDAAGAPLRRQCDAAVAPLRRQYDEASATLIADLLGLPKEGQP